MDAVWQPSFDAWNKVHSRTVLQLSDFPVSITFRRYAQVGPLHACNTKVIFKQLHPASILITRLRRLRDLFSQFGSVDDHWHDSNSLPSTHARRWSLSLSIPLSRFQIPASPVGSRSSDNTLCHFGQTYFVLWSLAFNLHLSYSEGPLFTVGKGNEHCILDLSAKKSDYRCSR